MATTSTVGKRGTVVIPASMRKRFGLEEGSLLIAEATEEGILLRPAVVLPTEIYTPLRQAEFLLSNTVDRADYASARELVEQLGIDPDAVPHRKPTD